jgi:hypothetical protein
MIGTTGATVLFSINVLFAALLGIGAGGLTCLALRQSWGLKEALIDAVLAAVVAVVAAYVVAAIESARGVWESRVLLILAIAVASVVVRKLIRLKLRSAT